MGLLSRWFAQRKSRCAARTCDADQAMEVFTDLTSDSALLEIRSKLAIPEDSQDFEQEVVYLCVFLISLSIELAYESDPDAGVRVGRAFMDRVRQAMGAGGIGGGRTDFDTAIARYRQYLQLRQRGLTYLLEHLAYVFLVTNGVVPSGSRDDLQPAAHSVLIAQMWIARLFSSLCEMRGARTRA